MFYLVNKFFLKLLGKKYSIQLQDRQSLQMIIAALEHEIWLTKNI